MEIEMFCGKFAIKISEFKKYKNGKLMYDIACCNPDDCSTKEAYLEMLEYSAEEILSQEKQRIKEEVGK